MVSIATLSRRDWSRHRFLRKSRNHLIPIRDLPHSGGDNSRSLLHIVRNDPLVGVEVGVMGHTTVLDRILRHADPWQSRVVKRSAIRSPRLAAIGVAHAANTPIGEQPEYAPQSR